MTTAQGLLVDDPCGGTGLLSIECMVSKPHPFLEGEVVLTRTTVAARCLCEKGQLQMSPSIPLVTDVASTTEELQDLFPAGIPELMARPVYVQTSAQEAVKTKVHGPLCRCGHRLSQHDAELTTKPCRKKDCECLVFRGRRVRK